MSDIETLVNLDLQGLAVPRATLLHVSTNSVATLGVLTGVCSRWSHTCLLFYRDFNSKKFLHARNLVLETPRPKVSFKQRAMIVFGPRSAFFVAGMVGAL